MNKKIYRLILRYANGATEEVEPYSRDEVAKYLLPHLNLETALENWRAGYTETLGEGPAKVECIRFVGDIPEGVRLNGQTPECPEEKNILDCDLPAASAAPSKLKLPQLCGQAIEIMSAGLPGGPDGERVSEYLHDLNLEIVKRVAFVALITLLSATVAFIGSGMVVIHVLDGTIAQLYLSGIPGAFTAAVIMAPILIFHKKMIVLEDWAATWAANLAARWRGRLERRQREKSEGDDGQQQ